MKSPIKDYNQPCAWIRDSMQKFSGVLIPRAWYVALCFKIMLIDAQEEMRYLH